MLAEESVALLPGSCFGADNYFRVVVCPPEVSPSPPGALPSGAILPPSGVPPSGLVLPLACIPVSLGLNLVMSG